MVKKSDFFLDFFFIFLFFHKIPPEVKKTFALRQTPQAPQAPGGLGRNAKVFFTSPSNFAI